MDAYIYGLIDPRDERLRYIGRTHDIETRYRNHCRSGGVTPILQWCTELREAGLKPTLVILCKMEFMPIQEQIQLETVIGNWPRYIAPDAVEKSLIQFYDSRGCELLNITHTSRQHDHLKACRDAIRGQSQIKFSTEAST